MNIEPIAHIESPYPTKFGVPRQPGLVRGLVSWLVLDGDAGEGAAAELAGLLRGGAERLWLVWAFSENAGRKWSPTVRPPRLGGNARVGVFATRSSFRPNGLAVSAVDVAGGLAGVDGTGNAASSGTAGPGVPARVPLSGTDMVDGTPVYAVRPFDAARDCISDASPGWLEGRGWPALAGVEVPPALEARIPRELRQGVREMLAQDPRPAYTRATQPDREFWVPVGRLVVSFRVEGLPAGDGHPTDANHSTDSGQPAGDVAVVTDVRELDDAAYARLKKEGTI